MKSVLILSVGTILLQVVTCQPQAPGVPPLQAQGVVPPQQAFQAQGVVEPQQVQQMNQQQGQGYQQPPVQGHQDPNNIHVAEGRGGDTLRFKNDIHNKEHVMEHLQEVIETKPKEQMTEEELEFHYFKMHDYNGDNKLDGVEIGKALTHFHGDERQEEAKAKIFPDEEIANIVDEVLKENDINSDGYIEYFEFKRNQDTQKKAPPAAAAGN